MKNIALVETRKVVLKETQLVVGKFPYKLLNGDIAFSKWEVNFGKQILASLCDLSL
jgi:hypothetical protein